MHIEYPKFLKVAFAKTLKKIIHNKKLDEQDNVMLLITSLI